MLLTAEMLLNYQRCNRRAFLDAHGDSGRKDAPSDYLQKLFQDSAGNHRSLLQDKEYQRPMFDSGDWPTGAEKTLELMRQGVETIYQPILLAEIDGVTWRSVPDLLIKQPGQSYFGDWMYTLQEIKLSKRAKTEYQVVVAYHTRALAEVQGAWPEEAFLNLKDKGLYAVDLWEMLPRLAEVVDGCLTALSGATEPEVFISRNRCGLCHWYNYCYDIASTQQHLSLLPGVTQGRYAELQKRNITTLETLASMPPKRLETLPGFGLEAATRLARQANVTLHNRALPADGFPHGAQSGQFLQERLPTAPIELYFDIESEPSMDLIYLHGVLLVDRTNNTQEFHKFLADNPDDERKVWEAFLEFVWMYPTAPIFHFCPYEVQTVNKLAKLYGTPRERVQPLLPRFVDLHAIATQVATLPVESYALKNIARWMGFDWRDSSANGAQSIYWYAQWLSTQEQSFLDSIVVYNEDDCRATYHIKEWLVDFVEGFDQALLAS
ncbi:TM0106 family RecB-like putative nuclease [filamentous cyanobacterium LEGE 11480]|uniref:TM0106 family RecB-like putative nuclease n=1 Tax=Romeriopsis navalis LEGE 11480 TaxID=2777977 RepID=A0A928VN22_9CYAN|nr:TM0106 family RecB-like putative nuclease [Romeriopsis navalis]MBE9031335.1 TM0106 family RecB-like putative nuclease [Romeriopsis navalis LEGE 11480]